MLEALCKKRVVFFTGKGGVGRSTCATAFALANAQRGRRVLLCEMGARPASTEFLEVSPAGHYPTQPRPEKWPDLWVACLDAHKCLEEYLTEQLKASRLVRLATRNRVLKRLWDAAPSVNEMSLLITIFNHERANDDTGRPRFDLIVVDMPATGHALAMLGVPRGAFGMIRVGSLAKRAEEVDLLLRDHWRSAVCVVTLAEELPVNESLQLLAALRGNLNMAAEHVVVNGLLEEVFEAEDEKELFESVLESELEGPSREVADVASRLERRRKLQQLRRDELLLRLEPDIVVCDVYHTSKRGLARVELIARALLSGGPAEACA